MTTTIKTSPPNDIRNAVKNANAAQQQWHSLGLNGRTNILLRLYQELEKRKEELALLETKEMGMPIKQSLADIDSGLNYFKWYLDNAEKYLSPEVTHEDTKSLHKVYYEPVGTVAVISPWNFPFSNFIWGVTPNLVVGNTVVYKHSEECMVFGKKIEDIIKRSGVPAGVFSEVYGGPRVGDFLVHQDIDMICFTGSTQVGQHLYEVASKKLIRVVLELGGSAPGIVFKDADLDAVMESIYFNKFLNCGQVCDGLKRLLVEKNIFDESVEKLRHTLEGKKVGDPQEQDTELGPLVSEKQLKTLETQVKDAVSKGARIIIGGKRSGIKGNYYMPTLLTNIKPNMKVWKEEVFGPVLPIVPFASEEEAVRLANDTEYGLGAYVFTKDEKKAARVAAKIKSGMVAVNNASYILPCNPFGGYKMSGIGREHGEYGLRELCQIKVVAMEK